MNAIELGATLYTPALNPAALENAYGAISGLHSMVICLEDAIRDHQVEMAERELSAMLNAFRTTAPAVHVFVRPRSIEMLVRMLRIPGIENVRGFVLPKISTHSLHPWLSLLMHEPHAFMPTIEGEEAFDPGALARLRDLLLPYRERVPAVRIGGNDLLNLIGTRRSRERTAYDGPLAPAIRNIVATFSPHGFGVAAPVFEHFRASDVLDREVELDVEHGLLTKTAIHPCQIAPIQARYMPSRTEMAEARAILDAESPAVFASDGSMCERATHVRWAGQIVQRAQIHGVREPALASAARVA